MRVIESTGEKYEVLDKASDAVIAADLAWGENPGSREHADAFYASARAMSVAAYQLDPIGPEPSEQAWRDFQALLADAMDRGEHEASDDHYDSKPVLEACEVDEVDSDPWVEDGEAVAADLQADAQAREIEGQA